MGLLDYIRYRYRHNDHEKPSEERLAWLRQMVGSDPEGKRLLDQADKLKVPISLGSDTSGGRAAFYYNKWGPQKIVLNPKSADRHIVQSLIHELRHLDIYEKTSYKSIFSLSPCAAILMTRIMEGDTHAYSAVIAERIEKITGEKLFIDNRSSLRKSAKLNESASQKADRIFRAFQKAALPSVFYDLERFARAKKLSGHKTPTDSRRLTQYYNDLTKAMTIDGTQINYLGAKNTAQLSRMVQKNVPVIIRKAALKIDKDMIRRTIG